MINIFQIIYRNICCMFISSHVTIATYHAEHLLIPSKGSWYEEVELRTPDGTIVTRQMDIQCAGMRLMDKSRPLDNIFINNVVTVGVSCKDVRRQVVRIKIDDLNSKLIRRIIALSNGSLSYEINLLNSFAELVTTIQGDLSTRRL